MFARVRSGFGPRFASLTLAVLAIAVVSCSDGSSSDLTGPGTPSSGLIPLNVGTRWSYDRVDSVEFTTDTSLHSYHTTVNFRVIADTMDALGHMWAVLDSSSYVLGGLISGHNYVANLADGVYELFAFTGVGQGSDTALTNIDFPYPASKGATFAFGMGIVLSTDSVMTVPAGTFHCLVYAEAQEIAFVAPGVGVVMRSLPATGSFGSNFILQDQVFYYLRSVTKS